MLIVKLAIVEVVKPQKYGCFYSMDRARPGGQFPPESGGQFLPEQVVSLRRNQVVSFSEISTFTIEQGKFMSKPSASRIDVELTVVNEEIKEVYVGGHAHKSESITVFLRDALQV